MRTGVIASAVAHTALIAFGLLSLGAAEPLRPEVVESISVDLVSITDFTNIRAGSLDSTVVETDTPSVVQDDTPAELAQPTGNTEEDQATPLEAPTPSPAPTVNTAPEPAPAPQLAPVPEPKPEPAPTPAPAPTPEPTPAPEPDPTPPAPALAAAPTPEAPAEVVPQPVVRTASLDQKRAEFKKQQEEALKEEAAAEQRKKEEEERVREARLKEDEAARIADEVANIINNEESRGATTGAGGDPTLGKPTGQAATLSQTQIGALVAQIQACLSPPVGAEEQGVTATLRFSIADDGRLVGEPQLTSAVATTIEDAYARAALRAVKRCGPYVVAAGQDVEAQFRANPF